MVTVFYGGEAPEVILAEFPYVGAGDKLTASTDYDRGSDGIVGIHRIDRRQISLRHSGTERVHRWIVDRGLTATSFVFVVLTRSFTALSPASPNSLLRPQP